MILEDRTKSSEGFPSNGDWENKNSKKGGGILRPKFLCAADYAFYLRRHLSCERRRNDPAVGAPGDETLSAGIPRLSFLLRRLEEDIHTTYLSFLEEFVSDLHDGLGCLLSLLRTCGERQKGAGLFTYATCGRARNYVIHRGAIDEFYCLLCLKACTKSSLAVSKMSEHKTGLASIASCITSTHMRSRIVAIELLTVVCRSGESGHSRVVEAMSAVRVLFGESVRFKCLVSVLNSNLLGAAGLETTTLVFLNTLLDQCRKLSDRIRIQSELEEAGLDIDLLEKQLRGKFGEGYSSHRVWAEIDKWRELRVDLQDALHKHQENIQLKREVELLKDALKRLRDERKGILSIHSQLKGQWNSMEQRLQDLTLKSRVLTTSSSASSSSEDINSPPQHESELDEILIDIPTIPAGSILDVTTKQQYIIPSIPPPLPPNHPRLSDSGVGSSHSPPDSEPDSWNGPDHRRNSSGRVRFSDTGTRRRVSSSEVLHSESFSGAVKLLPGHNPVRCADIQGVPPPLPARPKKRRSHSAGRSILPKSLQRLSRKNSRSACDLNERNEKRPPSRMGSSLDGMIHREIAKAIRDRHALFEP
ncbi:uncharacterized protein LOC129222095 [Uloborus diversus]|uniref:uncharacterized protein LOC129222095 n=1 Tax=Uloborus diversus TaxID=327109 RepID=UPI00240995A3|nr:uncharacterized protein LOC129222095 [Uloborus diversus]